jgi:hypothetical protein
MALTIENKRAIYAALAVEEQKASRVFDKACAFVDITPDVYGGSPERELAVVMANLRKAQLDAARAAATEFFNSYIREAV